MKYVLRVVNEVYDWIRENEVGVIIVECSDCVVLNGHRALYVTHHPKVERLDKTTITSKNFCDIF